MHTEEQKQKLEEYFKNCPYLTYEDVALVERTNVRARQVQNLSITARPTLVRIPSNNMT